MWRWMVVLLLAVALAGGGAYYSGLLEEYLGGSGAPGNPAGSDALQTKPDLGGPLYAPVQLAKLPEETPRGSEPLVIDPCHVVARQTQDVSSPREGHLLFIGQDVTDQAPAPPDQMRPVQLVKIFDGQQELIRKFRPLEEGDIVEPRQVVAVVNPWMAARELESKKVKVKQAVADHKATGSMLEEAKNRHAKLLRLRGTTGNQGVSDLDIGEALMMVAKLGGEEVVKKEAINGAKEEQYQAELLLSQYYLDSKLFGKGVVKKIYKHNGEGLKPQETVLELQNISQLRVEGSIDSQFAKRLQAHMNASCYLEPSVEIGPRPELLKAHRDEVTSVAVCADGEHFVSGSADKTVCVWQRGRDRPVRTLEHQAAVRTVACSPRGAWLVVGCDDGSLTLWDLDLTRPMEPGRKFKDQHRGPVTALAFSPDGAFVASGGEDNAILLWKTATGEVLYPFDADHGVEDPHQGTITSLYFTPQCKLVSAARDNTLRVWALQQLGVELEGAPIPHRDGTVSQLGVSADGRYMLFDKGKTLQLLDIADRSTACALENLANPFDTLALFAPDGSLMLTGGAGEGRLHLWKTPTPQEHAYQVRELVTKDRTAITSAAFAPAGRRFAVTGSKGGYVHMWPLPDTAALDRHRIVKDADGQALRLDLVEQGQAAGKTRIAVNVVVNPEDRLLVPGQRVALVVVLPLEGQ